MTDNRLTAEELDALTALERARDAFEIGSGDWIEAHNKYADACAHIAPRLISSARALAEAERRVTELEAALKPFAKEGDKWAPHVADDHRPEIGAHGTIAEFTVGDLRRARAARLLNGETK